MQVWHCRPHETLLVPKQWMECHCHHCHQDPMGRSSMQCTSQYPPDGLFAHTSNLVIGMGTKLKLLNGELQTWNIVQVNTKDIGDQFYIFLLLLTSHSGVIYVVTCNPSSLVAISIWMTCHIIIRVGQSQNSQARRGRRRLRMIPYPRHNTTLVTEIVFLKWIFFLNSMMVQNSNLEVDNCFGEYHDVDMWWHINKPILNFSIDLSVLSN
jgi:hypothetical protein